MVVCVFLSAPTATHPMNREYSAESKQPQMDCVKCDEREHRTVEATMKKKKKTTTTSKPNPPSCRERIRKANEAEKKLSQN